jgi:hypothetical protein
MSSKQRGMTPVKAWAVLKNGHLRSTDDVQATRVEAEDLADYLRRFDSVVVSIVRVLITEIPPTRRTR